MKLIKSFDDLPFGVSLHQETKKRFRVTYGAQVEGGLTYEEAAREFGLCVFHALACDGLLEVPE